MSDQTVPDEKLMRLRFDGVCRVCGVPLLAKAQAVYERATKTVRCVHHAETEPSAPVDLTVVDPGTPGASARREFERRRARREQRIREKHPKIGGLLHAISDEPQSTTAWDSGALGEEGLGNRLNELSSDRLRVLHDRRLPRSRANIDHLAITATGVYVIDAKKYVGRPRLKIEGGLIRPRVEKLLVGSRDCTRLVDGVLKQVNIVKGIVAEDVPVLGVLCFVEADWPLFGGDFTTREVDVLWPRKLYPRLNAAGSLTSDAIDEVHRCLALSFPPA